MPPARGDFDLVRGEALQLFFDHRFGEDGDDFPYDLFDDLPREREHRGDLRVVQAEVLQLGSELTIRGARRGSRRGGGGCRYGGREPG